MATKGKSSTIEAPGVQPVLLTVPIGTVRQSPDNPRTGVGDVKELAASIASVGILEPLLVTANGGGYQLVAGARRLAAAKVAGLQEIPVIVRTADDAARAEIMLVENLQREDLTPMEEARAFKRLVDDHGYSQRRLAERIGRSQAHVSKRLALVALPEPATKALDSGGISVADALELTKIADDEKAVKEVVSRHRGDMKYGVELVLEEREHERAYQEARARAEKDPAPFVEWEADIYGRPKGFVPLGVGYQELPISPNKHRKEPCHAVTVDPRRGYYRAKPKLQYVCTTPGNHRAAAKEAGIVKGGKLSEKEKAERAKKREHNKALREAEVSRAEFMRALLKKQVATDEALASLTAAWLTLRPYASFGKEGRIAVELLELDVPEPKNPYGDGISERNARALRAFAAKSKANVARVALALALEVAEAHIRGGWFGDSTAKGHYDFLRARGYKITPSEREELKGARR